MIRRAVRVAGLATAVFATAVFTTVSAAADDARAVENYMVHCQGCHLAKAIGVPGHVPRMKDFVGYFLHSQEGREFLIRVPGVATSTLPDDQLTELMNWLVQNYSAAQLPGDFEPFTVAEVAVLRKRLEPDPKAARRRILDQIAEQEPSIAAYVAVENN